MMSEAGSSNGSSSSRGSFYPRPGLESMIKDVNGTETINVVPLANTTMGIKNGTLEQEQEHRQQHQQQLVVTHSQSGHETRLGDFLRQLKCSGYRKLPESCGLSVSELEAMAARQARQLETQEQLLAAKAQRLRYLKSGGEAERLQRLREKVTSQEERLRKLRALRGKVQTSRNGNSVLNSDLESLRAVFNEKEKELSLAVAKVDELTRQLEDLRRGNKEPTNGQSVAAAELDKLRRELMYRQKLREAQASRVAAQKAALVQRQEEGIRVDRRIAELQERLHRKRLLNHQLAATLNHQENDFVGVPNKNDPKYQTLPYNAKLFAPFINKQQHQQQQQIQYHNHPHYQQQLQQQQQDEQDQFESVLQQMQLIGLEQGNSNNMTATVQSMNFENNLRLHQLISQNQHNAKSPVGLSQNGPQTIVHNSLSGGNKGKTLPVINNTEITPTLVRPSNFLPTGAPTSGTHNNAAVSSDLNGLLNSQIGSTNDHQVVTSSAGSSGSSISNFSDGFGSSHNGQGIGPPSRPSSKPALPPKPAKPTPPPRQAHEMFSYNSRSSTTNSDGGMMMPDRTELPIKPKPLFLKKSGSTNMTTVSSDQSSTQGSGSGSTTVMEKESNNTSTSTTVRMAINHRRFELPPAFLFPEGDPPPSDLIPEHASLSSSGGSQTDAGDSVDATPLFPLQKSGPLLLPPGHIEEYTLPDLFPHPPMISGNSNSNGNIPSSHKSQQSQQHHHHQFSTATSQDMTTTTMSGQINSNHHDVDVGTGNGSTETLQAQPPQSNLTIARVNANQINLNSNVGNGNLTRSGNNGSNTSGPPNGSHHQEIETTELGNSTGEIINFCLENGNKVHENHISVMNIRIGRESPATTQESSGEFRMDSNSNQLEPYEAGMESGSPNLSEQSPEREETTMSDSTTNSSGGSSNNNNGNLVGIVRRAKKGNLKTSNREPGSGRRVSFDPLALLLDASLEGELDLVMKTAGEVGNPSAANDEGITALHNAICAGHAEVVRFLVEFGCDVNAQDSDGWTPLHCAASCNNVGMVKFLVERGACIFATTLSDHETAAEKCEEDEDGFGPCSEYLYSIQEKLGIINSGVVYGVFDYDAQNPDELCFRDRDRLMILRKGDEFEREWWWANLGDKQGYVPRNLLGLYPRVVPQKRSES